MSLSDLVYRFLPASAAVKTILNKTLRFSDLTKVNDPSETFPGVIDIPEATTEREKHDTINAARRKLSQQFAFISFSRKVIDPVLWAHYADNHQGIALGFQFKPGELAVIDYDKPRKTVSWKDVLDYLKDDAPPSNKMWDTVWWQTISQKAESWRYEDERRIIKSFPSSRYRPFSANELREVILGINCEFTLSNVSAILKASGLSIARVKQVQRCEKSYRLVLH